MFKIKNNFQTKTKDTQKGHGAIWSHGNSKFWCYILQSASYLDPHQHWWGDTSGRTRSRHSPGGFEMPWLKAPGPTLPGVSNPKVLLLDFQRFWINARSNCRTILHQNRVMIHTQRSSRIRHLYKITGGENGGILFPWICNQHFLQATEGLDQSWWHIFCRPGKSETWRSCEKSCASCGRSLYIQGLVWHIRISLIWSI